MICQQCKDEDKKSNVYEGYGTVTAMYCPPYYDEEGKKHHHDLNTWTINYSCSNGHDWSVKSSGQCWCGWGKS